MFTTIFIATNCFTNTNLFFTWS